LLESDLFEAMVRCAARDTPSCWSGPDSSWSSGIADCGTISFKDGFSATTVIVASGGYPGKYPKGVEITGLPDTKVALSSNSGEAKTTVYHAGTKEGAGGKLVTSGGRVLAVTGLKLGASLEPSIELAYETVNKIR
tara:strand:- start:748 stop:1155 length:408 start_codon:yes stop_codon:yes gene_type:complete